MKRAGRNIKERQYKTDRADIESILYFYYFLPTNGKCIDLTIVIRIKILKLVPRAYAYIWNTFKGLLL